MDTPEFWLGLVMGVIITLAIVFGPNWNKSSDRKHRDNMSGLGRGEGGDAPGRYEP